MYHVSAQGVGKRMINVHYYYYYQENARKTGIQARFTYFMDVKAATRSRAPLDQCPVCGQRKVGL